MLYIGKLYNIKLILWIIFVINEINININDANNIIKLLLVL